jgi:hypothetical protein
VLKGCFVCLLAEFSTRLLLEIVDACWLFEFWDCILPELALIVILVKPISLALHPSELCTRGHVRCVFVVYTFLHGVVTA